MGGVYDGLRYEGRRSWSTSTGTPTRRIGTSTHGNATTTGGTKAIVSFLPKLSNFFQSLNFGSFRL